MIHKRLTALLVCITLLCSLSASAQAADFPYTSQESWTHEDMQKATDYGLFLGLDGGALQPETILDRASFAAILQRMFGWESVTPATPSFTDLQPTDWCYAAAETARAHGVAGNETLFQPTAYLTREDMAVMLVRALGYETLSNDIAGDTPPFPDVTTHPGHIALAVSMGLTSGVEVDGQRLFQPGSFVTWGQAAAMLVRVYERYTSKLDFINGFYAFSSYSQIGLTAQMDVVSVGWARMDYDLETGPWLNSARTGGNDWVKPVDFATATSYFQGNGTPYNLNVYADTTQSVERPDGTKTSVLELLLPDPQARAKAISSLAAVSADYAGITIDFEGLRTELLKEDFVAFMTELRAALPAGKTLYVCVPPSEWYKGFDFRALGELCDKVIYMAHDYQWTKVADGYVGARVPDSPVTPFPKMYQALAAITDPQTGVQDKSKIALQISFGTAGFQVDENGVLADSVIYHPAPSTISTRLLQPDTVVTYDESARNPVARYTTEEGTRVLLWYEDARSVADKLTLARMFGITGVSIWRLGNVPNYAHIPNYDVWSAILAQCG